MSDQPSVKQTAVDFTRFVGGRIADIAVRLLEANGTEFVFVHPTSAMGPILDAFVDATAKPILCLHEYVAMSAADAYAAVSGKHGVVLLGDIVGPVNGYGGFVNSDENRRPVVVLTSRYRTGLQLKHNHDTRDVGGLVRQWTRWDFEVVRNDQVMPIIQQAFQSAATDPKGPTFVVFNEDHLLKTAESIPISDVSKYSKPASPQMDHETRAKVARILAESQRPLVITGYLGRNPEAVPKLVKFAETVATPVTEYHRMGPRPTMNFPMNSPLHLGFGQFLPTWDWVPPIHDADVILVLDAAIPCKFRDDAFVIHIDIDQASRMRCPYPADIRIPADSNSELPVLTEQIEELMRSDSSSKERVRDRLAWSRKEHERELKEWDQELTRHFDEKPISPWRLAHEINLTMDDQTLLAYEAGAFWIHQMGVRVNQPGSWVGNPGYFLGWGAGAGVGIGLAALAKKVLVLVGDGAFISGNGVGALWTAAHYRIPVMWVVDNNRSYAATKQAFLSIAGRGAETGKIIGQDIKDPEIEFTNLAESCNVFAEKVEEPEDLQAAFQRGFGVTMKGEPALIDVRTRSYVDFR